jgi:hypothetical protein
MNAPRKGRGKRSIARLLLGGLLAGGAGAGAGCGEDVTYSYYSIAVTFDQATMPLELMNLINACGVVVSGNRSDTSDLPCPRGATRYNLGTFEYSGAISSGVVNFTVVANDINLVTLARGESGNLQAMPNGTTTGSILVKATPEGMKAYEEIVKQREGR